jgi:hypothetical protein
VFHAEHRTLAQGAGDVACRRINNVTITDEPDSTAQADPDGEVDPSDGASWAKSTSPAEVADGPEQ